jgi:anti-sigma-K factor RskA
VNTKEYISSGIIESYVLGMVSAEEAEEFEKMCAVHAEVREARDLFEQQLEQNAIAVGIQPPKKLKSLILSEIEIDSQKQGPRKVVPPPQEVKPAPVIKFTPTLWKYVAAASIVLLVGSTFLNFFFFNQYKTYSNQYSQLLESQTLMAANLRTMQVKLDNSTAALEMGSDTNMVVVKMLGVEKHPGNRATVYWDRRSKDVYLMANNLPAPPAGKQYQLWAIVDGRPVDAGLLNWEQGNMLSPIKNIPNAQAFAITLEKEGGSPKPDMEAMYVIGNV